LQEQFHISQLVEFRKDPFRLPGRKTGTYVSVSTSATQQSPIFYVRTAVGHYHFGCQAGSDDQVSSNSLPIPLPCAGGRRLRHFHDNGEVAV